MNDQTPDQEDQILRHQHFSIIIMEKKVLLLSMILTLANSYPFVKLKEQEPASLLASSSSSSSPSASSLTPSKRHPDQRIDLTTRLPPLSSSMSSTLLSASLSSQSLPVHVTRRKSTSVRTRGTTRIRRTTITSRKEMSGGKRQERPIEVEDEESDLGVIRGASNGPWMHDLLPYEKSRGETFVNREYVNEDPPEEDELPLLASSLDEEQIHALLAQIDRDPDSVLELMGMSPSGTSKRNNGSSFSASLTQVRSRNGRNRQSHEMGLGIALQRMLSVYQSNIKQSALSKMKRGEGPQLSVVSPLDVLRQQLIYELARKRIKESRDQIQVNEQLLKSLGKRSIDDPSEEFFNFDGDHFLSSSPSFQSTTLPRKR